MKGIAFFILVAATLPGGAYALSAKARLLELIEAAATEDPACQRIAPFYLEVGDAQGQLFSKTVG